MQAWLENLKAPKVKSQINQLTSSQKDQKNKKYLIKIKRAIISKPLDKPLNLSQEHQLWTEMSPVWVASLVGELFLQQV